MAPLDMKEISKSLEEMIRTPNTSEALLFGARESMFREIFVFNYPLFQDKLRELVPALSNEEELICMLIALNQDTGEISELLCLEMEHIGLVCSSVCGKTNLSVEELGTQIRKILKA